MNFRGAGGQQLRKVRDRPGGPHNCSEAKPSRQNAFTAFGCAGTAYKTGENCFKAQRHNTEGKEVAGCLFSDWICGSNSAKIQYCYILLCLKEYGVSLFCSPNLASTT